MSVIIVEISCLTGLSCAIEVELGEIIAERFHSIPRLESIN